MGELPVANVGLVERRQHFLDGLSRILRADTWSWAWSPDEPGNVAGLQYGNLSREEAAHLARVLESRDASTPLVLGLVQLVRLGRATTTTLRTLLPNTHALPVSGDVLLSWLPGSTGGYSYLWFCRRESGKPFTTHEERLLHVVFNEVAWLRGEFARPRNAGASSDGLPPRARMVLTLLLDGKVAKEIAQTLGISTRTVREHIERIYRHFGVDGRPGLHRHFAFGGPSAGTRDAPQRGDR